MHACDGETDGRTDGIGVAYTRCSIYAVARKNRLVQVRKSSKFVQHVAVEIILFNVCHVLNISYIFKVLLLMYARLHYGQCS